MNSDLRNGLWNAFYSNFYSYKWSSNFNQIYESIFIEFLKIPIDEYKDYHLEDKAGGVKKIIMESEWHFVFDFIEFVAYHSRGVSYYSRVLAFVRRCNAVLTQENSPYRIIGKGFVLEITSKQEIDSIETALQIPYESAKKHIENALALLSNREKPDYKNSIKESISAVESIAKEVTGNKKATLSQLTQKLNLHPAFEDGLKKLYGFTSDAGGIRHSDHPDNPLKVGANTARFMLVTCSAFVNYIIVQNS